MATATKKAPLKGSAFFHSYRLALHVMALSAFVLNRKRVFALVMTCSTGFPCFHICHGGFYLAGFVGEDLGVTINTFVGFRVELVTEYRVSGRGLKRDLALLHSLVALVAISA